MNYLPGSPQSTHVDRCCNELGKSAFVNTQNQGGKINFSQFPRHQADIIDSAYH